MPHSRNASDISNLSEAISEPESVIDFNENVYMATQNADISTVTYAEQARQILEQLATKSTTKSTSQGWPFAAGSHQLSDLISVQATVDDADSLSDLYREIVIGLGNLGRSTHPETGSRCKQTEGSSEKTSISRILHMSGAAEVFAQILNKYDGAAGGNAKILTSNGNPVHQLPSMMAALSRRLVDYLVSVSRNYMQFVALILSIEQSIQRSAVTIIYNNAICWKLEHIKCYDGLSYHAVRASAAATGFFIRRHRGNRIITTFYTFATVYGQGRAKFASGIDGESGPNKEVEHKKHPPKKACKTHVNATNSLGDLAALTIPILRSITSRSREPVQKPGGIAGLNWIVRRQQGLVSKFLAKHNNLKTYTGELSLVFIATG
ncbi:hypothetical protein EDB19DRAFT_1829939 [Suillus lakei]|nr:hypothetical protein EDB19DRAFT_1829939 [Suillus lakei]